MEEKLEIEYIPLAEIIPYSNNPRKNNQAVDTVIKSIKEFGFKNPIILDKNNEIIAGHTRFKAAQKLGMIEVPVIWVEDLTEDQVKAFRIMDNKSQEMSEWDLKKLKNEFFELEKTDSFNLTGFNPEEIGNILDDIDIKKISFNKYEIRLIFPNEEKLVNIYNQIEPILTNNSIKVKMDQKLKEILK